MKTAIVYDRVNKWGGAERVLLTLHELFPEAPLYTSVYSSKKALWAQIFPDVFTTFLNKISFAKDKHEFFGTLMPIAFETLDFSGYDLVISVTSEAAKGIIVRPPTLHICYCLTPTRYLWSHYDTYFKSRTLKAATKPVINYLRGWDKIAGQRPDVMIGISTAVQERIKKYYGRESELIYPPVEISKFQFPNNKLHSKIKFKDYFLVVSRLVPYKKVDLVIDVFNDLKLPLIIIGDGSEERKLKKRAKDNITFLKNLTDKELAYYYQNAWALIFAGEEDFGIVMVEAQASGIPVIAYKKGGALDIVIEGKTGIFFEEQTIKSLSKAVMSYKELSFSKRELVKKANRFTKEKFKREFNNLVQNTIVGKI